MSRHRIGSRLAAAGLALPLLVWIVGCGGGDRGGGDGSDAFASQVRTLSGPELRIGSLDDPELAFTAVSQLAVLPDGRILSFHPQEQLIRRWSLDGRPDGTIGGKGDGPGEFNSVRQFGVFGDTVWTMDSNGFRATYFDPAGALLATVTVPTSIGERGMAASDLPPRPSRPFRDGTFYANQPAFSDAIARGDLTRTDHVRMNARGEVAETLWQQEYRPTDLLALLRESGGTFGPQPFTDAPRPTIDDSGLTVLDRRTPESVDGAAVHVTRIDVRGDTLFHTRLPYTPEPLLPEQVDSAVSATTEGMFSFMSRSQEGLTRASLESDLREATFTPRFIPWAVAPLVTLHGETWVRLRASTRVGSTEWRVLDAAGDPSGTVFTPDGLRVLLVDGDSVYGVEQDEFDVDYIVRYRLADEG